MKLFVLFFDVIKSCRGNEAKGTIFGALGNVTEAIKSKLTMPSDIVEETRAAREHGGRVGLWLKSRSRIQSRVRWRLH